MSTESLLILLQLLRVIAIFLIIAILGYLGYVIISFKNIVPFVPTPKKIVKKMVELAQLKKGDKVVDLGSGTGRIVLGIGRKHKDVTIVGVERSPILRFITNARLLIRPRLRKRTSIINKDFFNLSLTVYSAIFCFITPEGLRRLTPKFKMLKKGSKIVSYMFPLPSAEGFSQKKYQLTDKNNVYVYVKR